MRGLHRERLQGVPRLPGWPGQESALRGELAAIVRSQLIMVTTVTTIAGAVCRYCGGSVMADSWGDLAVLPVWAQVSKM